MQATPEIATESSTGAESRNGSASAQSPSAKEPLRHDGLIGATIDNRYEVQARLGEGGMGIVYKARHVLLNKTVAIKVLRNTQNQEAWQRFVQEAQSASMLNHSNVVAMTDFGVLPDKHAYLVMEYLEGKTLTQAIAGQPIGAMRSVHIAIQIARGLGAVHEKGVIHRDLKPDNVFLQDKEGQHDLVKIMDFGVAKVWGGARLTAHGMVMGTAEYISPEQASGKPVDHRCDQYALGCLLYEMLTGQQVFRAETPSLMMKAHVFEAPVSPRERRPDAEIPETLAGITLRLLAKNPDARFANMGELEQVLQAEADHLVQAPLQGGAIGKQLVRGVQSSKRLLIGVTIGIAAAALVVYGIMSAFQPTPPAAPDMRPLIAPGKPIVTAPPQGPGSKPATKVTTPEAGSNPAPTPAGNKEPDKGRPQKKIEKLPAKGGTNKLRVLAIQPKELIFTCPPDVREVCRGSCMVALPASADGKCVASGEGYASKPFPYSLLVPLAKKNKPLKISLINMRDK